MSTTTRSSSNTPARAANGAPKYKATIPTFAHRDVQIAVVPDLKTDGGYMLRIAVMRKRPSRDESEVLAAAYFPLEARDDLITALADACQVLEALRNGESVANTKPPQRRATIPRTAGCARRPGVPRGRVTP